jgi:hypothetical protein
MDSNYNQRGISTPAAKLMKAGVDQTQGTPRWMPIMAKCAISIGEMFIKGNIGF